MKVICAWCGKTMGEKPPFEDKRISHGQCPECVKKMEREMACLGTFKKAFEEAFPVSRARE